MTGTESGTSTRLGFVAAVAQAFEDAGVSHVFLHDVGRRVVARLRHRRGRRAREPRRRRHDRAGRRAGSAAAALRLRRALVPLLRDRDGRSRPPLPPARHRLRPVRNRALRRRGPAGARARAARGRCEHALAGRNRRPTSRPSELARASGARQISDQLRQEFDADPAGASTLLRAAFDDCGTRVGTSARRWIRPCCRRCARSGA